MSHPFNDSEEHTRPTPFHAFQPITSPLPRRVTFAAALSLAVALALGTCGKTDDGKTVGQKVDAALDEPQPTAAEVKVKTESAMAYAGAVMKDATQKGKAASQDTVNKAEQKFDDLIITAAGNAGLAKDNDKSALKINIDTKNGVMRLKGTAPTSAAKERAIDIIKVVKGVAEVDNQPVVKAS